MDTRSLFLQHVSPIFGVMKSHFNKLKSKNILTYIF